MKILSVLLLIVSPFFTLAQPTILSPTTTTDLPAAFQIAVSVVQGAATYTIEIGKDGVFSGSSPDYQTQTSSSRFLYVTSLEYGANYSIRTTSDVSGGAFSILDVSIKPSPETYVNNVTNGFTLPQGGQRFITVAQSGTTAYEWEFNTQSDFSGTGIDQYLTSTTANSLLVTLENLQPNTQYFVRTRSIIGSQGLTGVWTDEFDPGMVVNFFTPGLDINFLEPTTFNDLNAAFNIAVSLVPQASTYTIELGKDGIFSGSAPDYQTQSGSSRFLYVTGLDYGGNYTMRATTNNGALATQPITVKDNPQTYVTNITNGTVLEIGTTKQFITLAQSGATSYEWEFNTESDFSGSGANQFLATTSSNSYNLQVNDLLADSDYYVRTRAIIAGQSITGPWTDEFDPGKVVQFSTSEIQITILSPSGSTDLDAQFLINSSVVPGATTYTIQIGKDGIFSGSFPDFQSQVSTSRFFTVTGLDYGGNYTIRVTTDNIGSFETKEVTIKPFPETYVTNIADETAFNDFSDVNFITKEQHLTTSYEWEFNTQSDFTGTGEDIFTTSTATNSYLLDFDDLKSGTQYFVRTRSIIGSQGITGPWSNELMPDRSISIYTPMEVVSVQSPTDMSVLNRTGFKVWVDPVVGATGYTFQISTSPAFNPIIDEQNANKFFKDGTLSTGFDPNAEFYVYDFFGNPSIVPLDQNTTYYLRVKAFNSSQEGNYGPLSTLFTGTTSSFVIEPSDGTTGISSVIDVTVAIIQSASQYTLQLDTQNDFLGNPMEFTSSNHLFHITGLDYGTTYFARVKYDGNPYGPTIVSFSTAALPTVSIIAPMDGRTDWPIGAYLYANPESSADIYEWEIDTQSDFSSGSKLTATESTNGVSFELMPNTVYYARVRVTTLPPAITSDWSSTVQFTTVATPHSSPEEFQRTSNFTYPNPFTNSFQFKVDEKKKYGQIVVRDFQGNVILRLTNNSSEDLKGKTFGESFPKGLYVVHLVDEYGSKTMKLIKE